MWFLRVLLGFGCLGAFLASPFDKCLELVDVQTLEQAAELEDPDELEIVCPMILPFFDCIDKAVKTETGFTIQQMAALIPNPEVQKAAAVFTGTRGLFQELCTEDSELNTAYKEHRQCYQTITPSDIEECQSEGVVAYEAFKEFEDTVQEEAGENESDDDKQCMTMAYMSGCVAAEIHDKCGEGAFNLYQTMIKRTNAFKHAICSEASLNKLKTSFVDIMEVDDERKELFRLAFDLKRRRK